jgi:hypothetical protein
MDRRIGYAMDMTNTDAVKVGDIIDGRIVVWVAKDGSGFDTERI